MITVNEKIVFYLYGMKHHKVRIVEMGLVEASRELLVYAAYQYDEEHSLPWVYGQKYKNITPEQWHWLHHHIWCDVSYKSGGWESFGDLGGTLVCKDHGISIEAFSEQLPYDDIEWEEREI